MSLPLRPWRRRSRVAEGPRGVFARPRRVSIGKNRKGPMRAWVLWKMLKRERPRVAAGRAGWPPRMRARLCPPRVRPTPPRAPLPRVPGGGGGARSQKYGAALSKGSTQKYNLGKLRAERTFERISQKYNREIVLSNGGGGGAQKQNRGPMARALGRVGRRRRRAAIPASPGAMRPKVHPKVHSKGS